MSLTLTLNEHHFVLEGVSPALLPSNTLLFVSESSHPSPRFTFTFHLVEQLPKSPSQAQGQPWMEVFQRHNIMVWRSGMLERRLLAASGAHDAYAVYEESSADHADIWFLSSLQSMLSIDTVFISTLSLERHLAPFGHYVFHSAYMSHRGEAILLSGPSGAGKSTHAHLWEQFVTDTHVVNGDRSLISRGADGRYFVSGWPVCGSSGICHDERHPLRAIVFIEQTPGNQLIRESAARLFTRLYAQLTINHWDKEATAAAVDWVSTLLNTVPVMVYGCNMAPDAPFNLKSALFPTEE